MRRFFPWALALIVVLGLSACSFDDERPIFMAPGSYGDIAVVVSSDAMAGGLQGFKDAFNREFTFVIAREPEFNVDVYTPDKWELCKGYKNIIFLWRVGDGGAVEKMLRGRFNDEGEARVQTGTPVAVELKEPFASYQYALVVAGTDRNSLLSYMRRNAAELRERFETKAASRIMRRYRHEGLETELMSNLWLKHRFFMEIPSRFKLNQDVPDGYPAVEFMQSGPSRGLTIGWSQSSDPEMLMDQRMLLLELRKELGLKMHSEDVIPESLVWSTDTVGGMPAVRLEGAWNSRRFDGGGPFWCWFLADVEGRRVLCIDALAYAPGLDKMDYFRRLRAIVQTFSLERPQP